MPWHLDLGAVIGALCGLAAGAWMCWAIWRDWQQNVKASLLLQIAHRDTTYRRYEHDAINHIGETADQIWKDRAA